VLAFSTLGPVLWLLGYPGQALAQSQKGLALARELTQQYSVVYASTLVTRTEILRRERRAVRARINEIITLCDEHGFTSYGALSRTVRGWLLSEEGKKEGIEQMRQQLLAWRATGAESARPYCLALLAEACGKARAPADGLTVLAECWPWMDKTGGRVFAAELYRVQGELTLQKEARGLRLETRPPSPQASSLQPLASSGGVEGAEGYFLEAIATARRQQVKSLELRAAVSLARLRRQQAAPHAAHKAQREARTNLAEAHQTLAGIYNWFTEGFETKDLQEAKTLIQELNDRVIGPSGH
jgi:hypothetical protein